MRYILFIALKLLLERKRQTTVSTLGVAIGVSAFIAMSSLMMGFQGYFIQQVIDLEPHITIKPTEEIDEKRIVKKFDGESLVEIYGSKPKEKDKIIGWKDLVEELQKENRISGVAPRLVTRGILKYGVKEKPVTILGIDPNLEPKASIVEKFLENKNLHLLKSDKDTVIIGKLVAKSLGIREINKKLILVTPNGNSQLVKVVDFFNSGITNIDDARVYINMKTLQALMERPNESNQIILKVKDVNEAEKISKNLQKRLPFQVESWQRAYANFLSIFKIQNIITYMIVIAILTVSAFGILNIISMTVMEKRKDIAILMAMGYSRMDILLIFLCQGLIIGAIGAIIGCIVGFGLQEYMESIELDVEGIVRTKGFVLDRSPMYYLYGSLFSLLFSILASFYPSYKASKLNPVDIFRSGG